MGLFHHNSRNELLGAGRQAHILVTGLIPQLPIDGVFTGFDTARHLDRLSQQYALAIVDFVHAFRVMWRQLHFTRSLKALRQFKADTGFHHAVGLVAAGRRIDVPTRTHIKVHRQVNCAASFGNSWLYCTGGVRFFFFFFDLAVSSVLTVEATALVPVSSPSIT